MKRSTLKAKAKSNNGGSLLDKAREQAEAKFWKPAKEGDGIEGKIVRIIRDAGKYHSTFYHLETEAGIEIVAGGSTVLGQRLADQQLEVGDSVGILYLGEETSKAGQVFKNWSVVAEKVKRSQAAGNPPSDDNIPF
jgi:hypothetical protein